MLTIICIIIFVLCIWCMNITSKEIKKAELFKIMQEAMFDTLEQNLSDEQFFHIIEEYKKELGKRLHAKVEMGKVEDDD